MEKRLEVLVYIPFGRTAEKTGIKAFVSNGARELDKDELDLFVSGADEVIDKSFNVYKKFSDKSLIQGNLDKNPLYRIITYRCAGSLIDG